MPLSAREKHAPRWLRARAIDITYVSPLLGSKDWGNRLSTGLHADERRNAWSQWAALQSCNTTACRVESFGPMSIGPRGQITGTSNVIPATRLVGPLLRRVARLFAHAPLTESKIRMSSCIWLHMKS